MSEYSSTEKKLIRVPGDLITKLNEDATHQGKTFYSYISDVLEQAVRAYKMKRNLKEIIDAYEFLEVHKEAGTTLTPGDVLNYLIAQVYNENGEILKELWYHTGKWYGIYFKERFEDSVDAFLRLLKEGRWDINEVTAKRVKNIIELKCVSALLSQERTYLIENFIEGAMHSLGYITSEKKSFRGIIRIIFSHNKDIK